MPAPADHQLARVRAAEPHHQVDVGRAIELQQLLGPRDGLFSELDQIGRTCEREEIAPVRLQRGGDDLIGVRAVGVENVVAPVGVEDGSVGFAILSIGRFSVARLENREEIGEEIDQHGGQ